MMGFHERDQGQFFYDFCLDAVVPAEHLVRRIARFVDLSWVRDELAGYYSHTGRPSIDPELLIRMLLIGYVFAIRSERQLCAEVQVNLAYRWFCGLGIEDRVPDHSAFCRARHERFGDGEVYRRMFERVVDACIDQGLVGGASMSVDASLLRADVNHTRRVDGAEAIVWPDRDEAPRAVREYLEHLDESARSAPRRYRKVKPPKALSLTDPLAVWAAKKNVRPNFVYDANYLIDHEAGIIVDTEGTRANRTDELAAAQTMVTRTADRFGLKPQFLAGDTAYGASRMLKWLIDQGIEPHVPVWDKSARPDGKFSRSDFRFDAERNVYICPGGHALTTTGNIDQGRTIYYRGIKKVCADCHLRSKCTSGSDARKITRDIDEDVRDRVRALAGTRAFVHSARQRKKVEMAFAHLKRILKLGRLRLRGLSGARYEVTLAATAQNLRKLARYAPQPPPKPQPA